jgi:CRISPR-associated protein Cas5h
MSNEKLISFDLRADFGFFKKPDNNDGILLSYNMLHKPALLGILGAISGLEGYQKKGELPEYYRLLSGLQVSVEPLDHEKGNFRKTSVKYTNTVGYANRGSTLLIEETMLIKPAYRCYLLLDTSNEIQHRLYDNIKNAWSEYIPYLGKNEYQAWIQDVSREYDFEPYEARNAFVIKSVFIKQGTIRNQNVKPAYSFTFNSMSSQGSFCYFERLPIGFDESLMQYQFNEFVYTDWALKSNSKIENLYRLKEDDEEKIIQLY